MTDRDATRRTERALVAYVRQELSAPAMSVMGYAEMLTEDSVRGGRSEVTEDLRRILGASQALHRLILSLLDPAVFQQHEGSADLAEFRRKLRHDLRTPINAIKGYGEMLREDAVEEAGETFVGDLDRMLGEATLLLDRIDGLVTYADADAAPSQDIDGAVTEIAASTRMVESLLASVSAVAPHEAGMAAARSSLILVVDDNASNRHLLSRRLERQGHTVMQAGDGASALVQVDATAFDLVLLDLMMPGISGYEVLTRLKSDPRHRDLPIIMISALSELDSVVRCIEAGADDYLAKPFDPTLLRARVSSSLEKKRLQDEIKKHVGRMEEELQAARQLQLGMMPQVFPPLTPERPVEVFAMMEPAREIGGDLYDFFYCADGTFCFLVGDVSGKGVAAGLFMARTKSLIRMAVDLMFGASGATADPAEVVARVNRELCQGNSEMMFVTLFIGMLNPESGELQYCNAAHNLPYRLSRDRVETIEGPKGLALGIVQEAAYETGRLAMAPAEAIYLFTDGVTEATNESDELFSEERLEMVLKTVAQAGCADVIEAVAGAVTAFAAAAPQADDITAIAFRWSEAIAK